MYDTTHCGEKQTKTSNVKLEAGMMGGEQGRGTQDFILAKPIRQLISKHPGAQEYFLNSEDEHLQGHMEKTSTKDRISE